MTAYDECYLDSMLQKHRYLYKLIVRNCEDAFDVITEYMNGQYRKNMDAGNPLYLNKTPKQILGSMGIQVNLDAPISETYDEFILEWMADLYTYMQWKYDFSSSDIVKKLPPKELYSMYFPLHEASIEKGVEKLKKRFEFSLNN